MGQLGVHSVVLMLHVGLVQVASAAAFVCVGWDLGRVSVKGWNVKDHLSGLSVNWYWLYLGCFCYPSCYHSSSRSPDLFPV